MNTKNLIAWMLTHGMPAAPIDNADGTLTVECVVVYADRSVGTEVEVIAATPQAARDWLGY